MPKKVYTEKDIEDLVNGGAASLELGDEVVLTQMAYEQAGRLGLHLVTAQPDQPPSAPIRPYLSNVQPSREGAAIDSAVMDGAAGKRPESDLAKRIRTAVFARLGDQVEPKLLDVIIARVLKSTGMK